ncbi:DsbA family protein [Hyphomonas atlantica]|uniref:DsbA family protein n=1 Tax=Hyphomonas atlantica TaxID=1280948 RepID=UPI0032B2FA85|tara:strand:+ start:1126 stop:1869 length:744 start_codon:yes stop_codon:yes gene_type:complete
MNFKLTSMMAAGSALALTACADNSAPAAADREAMEQVVREYILDNPEIIEEALIKLAAKQKAAASAEAQQAIVSNFDAIYNNPGDYSIGPADAEITVVEFFDYRCGWCKRSTDWIQALPKEYDGNVRVVFKELPIFGGISETASLAALAAGKQDKYLEFHLALMDIKNNNDLTEAKLDEVAEDVGMNVQKMRADMKSMDIQRKLADSKQLARTLGVEATPSFFIGNEFIEGANRDRVNELIKEGLKG